MAARTGEGDTPVRKVRISNADWDELGRIVGANGRGTLLKEFIAWYLRRPGAKLPRRPPRSPEP